ncbi:MAG TPA: LacI family DNA-binding transcriptional regulator [Candidatus Sumerlaeia bacterium]|nr:LacI family DNA-binding transcriptional regulator [Candidatus Sumerlaeia bacterium]
MDIPKLTKHRLICETLKSQILNGTYPPDSRIPPETELTAKFQASRMTVNRAIKELQMAGYVRRTRGSGTYVLSRQVSESQLLAIMIPCLPDAGIYHGLVRSIEETAFSMGYSIILCNADFSFDKARSYIKELVNHGISGIFFSPIFTLDDPAEKCIAENHKLARLFIENRIPFLCVDSMLENFEPQNYVVPDNEESARSLMSLAIQKGHKKCLYVHSILNSSAHLRIKGARNAMKEHGLNPAHVKLIHLKDFMSMKPMQMQKYISDGISLIYAMDDLTALQVINHLKDLGLRVPEDLSLVSHDDLDFSQDLGLTTVHQDLEKEGMEAIVAMHRLINKEITNIRQLIPSRVVVRKTLGDYCPPAEPPQN